MQGCILLHGFTGSPDEVQPLADHLQKRTDWLISVPTLPGHGEQESLKDVSWRDWLLCAEVEFLRMAKHCDSIYVVGFSMGGLIASYLATKYPVERLVLLSPAIFHPNMTQWIEDIKEMFRNYPTAEHPLLNQLQRYKHKIANTPLKALFHFKKLVWEITPLFPEIEVPILIVQGEKDDLVIPKSASYIYHQVKSKEKELLFLPQSRHMICHDCEKEMVFQYVERFLLKKYSLSVLH